MPPYIGEVVHYVSYGTPGGEYTSTNRAATVTAVRGNISTDAAKSDVMFVDLCVLNPEGFFFNRLVEQDEETRRGGTWHFIDHGE